MNVHARMQLEPTAGGLALPAEHPLRREVLEEVHARPPLPVRAPARVSHLALLRGESTATGEHDWLMQLHPMMRPAAPPPGASQHVFHLGGCRVKWERHTEFSTYSVFAEGLGPDPFARPAFAELPPEWTRALPGELLVAVHLAFEGRDGPSRGPAEIAALFGSENIVGSIVGGAGTVWTDFRAGDDGFVRILLRDGGSADGYPGRLVQRLLEIETYRVMALLAFPLARDAAPRLGVLEQQLTDIAQRMTSLAGLDDERQLLNRLTRIAAEAEAMTGETSYRFAAARAYYALVERRIVELRESKIDGVQRIASFMDRRLAPAMRTLEAVARRQEALAARIERAGNLLRTRIDIGLEEQNRDLLRSMDRRALLQLRLQQTVEGLSVVAISYYLVGLAYQMLNGAVELGVPVDPKVGTAVFIPFAVLAVWAVVRRIKKSVLRRADAPPSGR